MSSNEISKNNVELVIPNDFDSFKKMMKEIKFD